ncbi:MAG: ATP-binding protein [Mariprofundaceae bacterium]|nr:ATP-binding protein [Mariprofundaceae bacterium]
MNTLFRLLPLLLSLILFVAIIIFLPAVELTFTALLGWINAALLLAVAVFLLLYGIRLSRQKGVRQGGSALRAKLVMALVGMLLIPAVLLQASASYVVNRGLDDWFDVRVEVLLDRAMKLAQGLYSRIDQELHHSLLEVASDPLLRAQLATFPLSSSALNTRMNALMNLHDWESMQIFDRNERLIASVQRQELGALEAETFTEQAHIAMTLGKITSEIQSNDEREQDIGYAPVTIHQNVVALIRASVLMPDGLVANARALEEDNKTYHQLARDRESLGHRFDYLMTLITFIIVLIAGFIAFRFARQLTKPVEQLAYALEQVTAGDLDVSITNAPNDELGSLVASFNIMTSQLKRNTQAVEDTQKELSKALADSQQDQHILENLLANLEVGVLLVNQDNKIHLSNQSFARLLDVDPKVLESISPDRMLATINMPAATARMQMIYHVLEELKASSEKSVQRQLDIPFGNKTRLLLVRGVSLSIPESSGFMGYLLVIDDLTELAEGQRHKAWGEVAQNVAHEIKNPLTPIKLAAERLQSRIEKQNIDPVVFKKCSKTIIQQVNRLLRLTSDFSSYASLPKPRISHVLATVFTEELTDLYAAYPRVNVQKTEADYACACDADQIRQVLLNLMDNALAASEKKGGAVRMYVQKEGNMTAFHIEDDGIGVHEKIMANIFNPYFSTKVEGSGLGLSISSRIAKEHGGSLLLLSCNTPTHFCLYIPGSQPA